MFSPIFVKKDNIVKCTYMDESVLPDKETLKAMRAAGYKFYQDGKLWKPEERKKQAKQD